MDEIKADINKQMRPATDLDEQWHHHCNAFEATGRQLFCWRWWWIWRGHGKVRPKCDGEQ
jgi:hypothetical protein